MNVLSLFDGISCGQVAFDKLGIKFSSWSERERESNHYFASEIKSIAIKCATQNYPNTIEIGDVCKVHYDKNNEILHTENGDYHIHIDVLIGGSPCQDFSIIGYTSKKYKYNNGEYGTKGTKSKLFYEYLRLKEEINPKYFLLENVKMKKESENNLNKYIGVNGIHINSSLVSYQNRERIYWTNIPNVTEPQDKKINFQDYKCNNEKECDEAIVPKTFSRLKYWNNGNGNNSIKYGCDNITYKNKIHTLSRKQDRNPNGGLVEYKGFCRFLTRSEIEQAQTLPVGYTNMLSYNQMQDVCGDGWTVDVIKHIFSFIPKNNLMN